MCGGEKRRLAVAGILSMERELLIFDEPFANLDWPGVRQVVSIMKELKEQEKTVVVLTHEIEKVMALASRFIVLDKGRLCFDGSPKDGLKITESKIRLTATRAWRICCGTSPVLLQKRRLPAS